MIKRTSSQKWRNQKWRWLAPILLVLMFLTILIWLPWQARRLETTERQEQLIADTLWVEQAIRFQINRNEEVLRRLGNDLLQDRLSSTQILENFDSLLKGSKEIQRIIWLDAEDRVIGASAANLLPNFPELTQQLAAQHEGKFQQIVDGKTHCLPITFSANGLSGANTTSLNSNIALSDATLNCQIPLIRENIQGNKTKQFAGSFIISYQLQGILDEMVPWWFAQENEISLIDENERLLADRSAGGPGKNVYNHIRSLDLPGVALSLRTNSIKSEPKLLSNLLVLSVIFLSLGLLWSMLALWRDINRRLAAEGALRRQLAFSAAMENSLITGLRARDMEGRLTYVNPSFCKMLGREPSELIGRLPPMPYWAPEALSTYEERFNQILSGTVPSKGFETIYVRANGERFPVLVYESPLVNEAGVQTGWMSSILDISELKHAQDIARQQQEVLHTSARLATMGEIASMLAHELNQPLAAISSYTAGALNMLQVSPNHDALQVQKALEKAGAQAQRAGQIIRSVHEFVKKREAKREALDIAQLITGVMPLIELQARSYHVKVQTELGAHLPLVLADKILIEQVLLNLTRNAIEAMADSPAARRLLRLVTTIEASNTIQKNEHALTGSIDASMIEVNQQVIVQVIDQGHGIAPEIDQQLFTPFFSTKPTGMGMGLNICRTAIEFHGGRLYYRPNPNGGIIFAFSLPLAAPHSK